jgi:hypothetical protein
MSQYSESFDHLRSQKNYKNVYIKETDNKCQQLGGGLLSIISYLGLSQADFKLFGKSF